MHVCVCVYIGAWLCTFHTFNTNCIFLRLLTHIQAFLFFTTKAFYLIEKVYKLYTLMLQIDPFSFLTNSICSVIIKFFVIALAQFLAIKSICGSSFCADSRSIMCLICCTCLTEERG